MFEDNLGSANSRPGKKAVLLLLSTLVAAVVTPLAYVRLRDEHRKLVFITAGMVCILLLGVSEVYWAFPALMVAYFMLDTRQATILAGGFVGCFLAIVWDELSAVGLVKICLTLAVTVLLAHALSLSNRRQMESLRRMANVDPLTGAGNRRAQNLKLETVNAIFHRSSSPASVLIIDIDHFKKINDSHGHIVGDQVLIELCELVRRSTRATETLYRYGGEEFLVVAEQTALDTAVNLAEKLRSQIAQQGFATGIRLTVSIGVAELQFGESKEAWLGRADAALYRAKGRGRNQVVVAEPPGPATLLRLPTVERLSPMAERSGEAPTGRNVLSRSM